MFREREKALCLSDEEELGDGSDQVLYLVRDKRDKYERERGAM